MTYMQQFEAELRILLGDDIDREAVVRFVKERVLESYRNGEAKGKKPPSAPKIPATPRQ